MDWISYILLDFKVSFVKLWNVEIRDEKTGQYYWEMQPIIMIEILLGASGSKLETKCKKLANNAKRSGSP